MSLPAIDPSNLPAIPLWVRQWIYLLYLVALLVANSVDVFYETGDPWWLAGALRVLNVVGLFIMGVVLAHTRRTPAELAQHAHETEADAAEAQAGLPPEADAARRANGGTAGPGDPPLPR